MLFLLEQEGGSLIAPMALAHPLHPIDNRSRNKRRNLWVGRCVSSWWPWFPSRSSVLIYICMCIPYMSSAIGRIYTYIQRGCHSVLAKLHPITFYRIIFLGSARFLGWMPLFVFFGLPIVSCSLIKFNTRMLVTFGICFKQHFDTRYLVFYNPSPPRMFLSLDLLWEYRTQHGANGPLYITSSYSTWIFCRGVSGFATDCPCGGWCLGLTTCLLHVGRPFGNRILNNSWAVGLTYWIINLFLCVFWNMQLYMSWYIRSFFGFTFLNISLLSLFFFKYSCTNNFHRRSLYTFYSIWNIMNCWAVVSDGDSDSTTRI